jgi:isopenicillin-N epimerase
VPVTSDAFPTEPDVVLLNHASFGVPTNRMMAFADEVRRRIERDAEHLLAGGLAEELRGAVRAVAQFLGSRPEASALTLNATEAASAVAASLGRQPGVRVAMADTEYPSVLDAWRIETAAHGGTLQLVRLDLPCASPDDVRAAFECQVDGGVDVVVTSLITSPTALLLPVAQVAEWAASRGAITVVDAAHGPGHVEFRVDELGAAVVYGTLHKWLPVPRPLGFLYADDAVRDDIRPATVALHRDEGLAERFLWRGTWDPAPALCFSAALDEWRTWHTDGSLDRAEAMANVLAERLTGCGLDPTGGAELLAPRLRGFVVPHLSEDELRRMLGEARVRAWTGTSPSGRTLLRVATHVFTVDDDVERLVQVVGSQPGRPATR